MLEKYYSVRHKIRRHWLSIFLEMNLAMMRYYMSRRGVLAGYDNAMNFGDQLTPDILRYINLKPIHCPRFVSADIIGVGSILNRVPEYYSGSVFGSGFINSKIERSFPFADVRLLRGALSRDICRPNCDIALGDPGIIADMVYKKVKVDNPIYELGIVAHYSHRNSAVLSEIQKKFPGSVSIVDVRRKPGLVVNEISKCKHIISSSLHGLVVADSLGIPNRWIVFSDDLELDNFKFRDYYSCYNFHVDPLSLKSGMDLDALINQTISIPEYLVLQIKNNVYKAVVKFREDFSNKRILS